MLRSLVRVWLAQKAAALRRRHQPRVLRVTVHGALHLQRRSKFGGLDPKVHLAVVRDDGAQLLMAQTQPAYGQTSPMWAQTFLLPYSKPMYALVFTVMDSNRIARPVFIGQGKLQLCERASAFVGAGAGAGCSRVVICATNQKQ